MKKVVKTFSINISVYPTSKGKKVKNLTNSKDTVLLSHN